MTQPTQISYRILQKKFVVISKTIQQFFLNSTKSKSSKINIKLQNQFNSIQMRSNGDQSYRLSNVSQQNINYQLFKNYDKNTFLKQMRQFSDVTVSISCKNKRYENVYVNNKLMQDSIKDSKQIGVLINISNIQLIVNKQQKIILLYLQQQKTKIIHLYQSYLIHINKMLISTHIINQYCLSNHDIVLSQQSQCYEKYKMFSKVYNVDVLDTIYFMVDLRDEQNKQYLKVKIMTTKLLATRSKKTICFVNNQLKEYHFVCNILSKAYNLCYRALGKYRNQYGYNCYVNFNKKALNQLLKIIQSKITIREQIKVVNSNNQYKKIINKYDQQMVLNKLHKLMNPSCRIPICIQTKTKSSLCETQQIKYPSKHLKVKWDLSQKHQYDEINNKKIMLYYIGIDYYRYTYKYQQVQQSLTNFNKFMNNSQIICCKDKYNLIVVNNNKLYQIKIQQIMSKILRQLLTRCRILSKVQFNPSINLKQLLYIEQQQDTIQQQSLGMSECYRILIQNRYHILEITNFEILKDGKVQSMFYPYKIIPRLHLKYFKKLLVKIATQIYNNKQIEIKVFLKYYSEYLYKVYKIAELSIKQLRCMHKYVIDKLLNDSRFNLCHVFKYKWRIHMMDLEKVDKRFERC